MISEHLEDLRAASRENGDDQIATPSEELDMEDLDALLEEGDA